MNGEITNSTLPTFETICNNSVIKNKHGENAIRVKGTEFGELKKWEVPSRGCDYVKIGGLWFQSIKSPLEQEAIEHLYMEACKATTEEIKK